MKPRQKNLLVVTLILTLALIVNDVLPTQAQESSVWSDPVNVSNSGSALDPVIVATSNGKFHAIWRLKTGGFRYSFSDDGVTWDTARAVAFPFVDLSVLKDPDLPKDREYPFRLIASPDGKINVFWITLKGDLYVARPNPDQLSQPYAWPGAERLGESVLNFDVDMTSQGVFHLAYIRTDDKAGIYYMRSPTGAVWSKDLNLYSSQYLNPSMSYLDAHLSVSGSDNPEEPIVLVGWDMHSLKRIFMATSLNNGFSFSDIRQVKGPEDTGGYGTPLNIELGVAGKSLLLMWQVGEQGATQCTVYTQSSTDAGQTWTDPTTMLDARSLCPNQVNFLVQQKDLFMVMFKYKGGNPSISTWNGTEWSAPHVQNELSSFLNPLTFDVIILGCKNETLQGMTLYIVGCDEGSGSDIWMTSRSLEPLDQWTGSSLKWNYPTTLALEPKSISKIEQLSDGDLIHAVWSQSSFTESDSSYHSIYYAQMRNGEWSSPTETISGLLGKPADITMALNSEGLLYIVWTDQQSSSLVYTTANAERAGLRTEWAAPREIPTGARLNTSPDILIDSSGRALIAYAVPFNEGRGIYLIQADGRDLVWSQPVQAFDAVAADWDRVDYPKISLTSDGVLHLLFSRVATDGDSVAGLYYARSSDGGLTWSSAEMFRESAITWSEIVTSDGKTLHRLWQEKQGGVVSNYDQTSLDSGLTWGAVNEITDVRDYVSPVSVAVGESGDLHFLRVVKGETPSYIKKYDRSVEDWQWDGESWVKSTSQAVSFNGEGAAFFLSGALTADGWLNAMITADYTGLDGKPQGQIVSMRRQLTAEEAPTDSTTVLLPTPQVVAVQPTATTAAPSVEALPSEESPLPRYKNVVGIALVLILIIVGAFLFWRRRRLINNSNENG